MKLPRGRYSEQTEVQTKGPFQRYVNRSDKAQRADIPRGNGKSDKLMDSPQLKKALKDISVDYQRIVRRKP